MIGYCSTGGGRAPRHRYYPSSSPARGFGRLWPTPRSGADADICATTNDAPTRPSSDRRLRHAYRHVEGPAEGARRGPRQSRRGVLVDRPDRSVTRRFDRAVALDPPMPSLSANAPTPTVSRTVRQALTDANQAVGLIPTIPRRSPVAANVFNNNRQYDRALADYSDAHPAQTGRSGSFMDRGVAYYFKQDYQSAFSD